MDLTLRQALLKLQTAGCTHMVNVEDETVAIAELIGPDGVAAQHLDRAVVQWYGATTGSIALIVPVHTEDDATVAEDGILVPLGVGRSARRLARLTLHQASDYAQESRIQWLAN